MRRIFSIIGAVSLLLAGIAAPARAGSEWNAKQAPAAVAAGEAIQKPVALAGEYVTKTLADGSKTRVPTAATEKAAKAAASARRAPTVCTPAPPTVCFHYGTGERVLTAAQNTGATQVASLISQHKPVLANVAGVNEAYHSLWETAIIDPHNPGGRNIVEVGATVDFALNGDSNTHLFVYHWVNDTTTCYNGCGWVDNAAEAVNAGTTLAVTASGAAPSVFYQYRIERTTQCSGGGASGSGNGWRIAWKASGTDHIIGAFCDTVWTGATPATSFTAAPRYQAFWEIASKHVETCADMGSGAFGTSTLPSSAADLQAASNDYAGNDWNTVGVYPAADTPTAFRIFDGAGYATPDTDRIRGGGPGYNQAGTGTGGIGTCV